MTTAIALPAPSRPPAGTKYWVQIEALQSWRPRLGSFARRLRPATGDITAERGAWMKVTTSGSAPGDAAFTLLAPGS